MKKKEGKIITIATSNKHKTRRSNNQYTAHYYRLLIINCRSCVNCRVPVSACVVNGCNLLTSVKGKLVGVQQVLGHVWQPHSLCQQSLTMHIQPNQFKQVMEAPIMQTELPVNTKAGDKNVEENMSNGEVKTVSQEASVKPNLNNTKQHQALPLTSPTVADINQRQNATELTQLDTSHKSVSVISSVSNNNNNQKASPNKNPVFHKVGKSNPVSGPLKVKFLWNRAEPNQNNGIRKTGNGTVHDQLKIVKDIPEKALISNSPVKHVLNVPKIRINTSAREAVEHDRTPTVNSKPKQVSPETQKTIQPNKSVRIMVPKLNSDRLKRLGCRKSSPYLLDIERKERKNRTNGIKRCRKLNEKPQRLTSLTQHPDFKHIPTTDKISFLKDLLKAQRSYLGL